jgi:hypothetical protein
LRGIELVFLGADLAEDHTFSLTGLRSGRRIPVFLSQKPLAPWILTSWLLRYTILRRT